jgi:anion-transporting  ArsA/GET3 family ATPase
MESAAASRGRSPARFGNNTRGRSTSGNRAFGVGPDVSKLEAQIGELRRNLSAVENDNDKLKETMREMVDDYTRQLELRDETIQRLEAQQPTGMAQ